MEKKKLNKIKNILVIVSLIIYIICTYISLRGEYLECLELGNQYIQNFWTNVKYKYSLMGISFIIIAIAIALTNFGIKKGLKPFFESENKKMPKLPNKSIIFVVSLIGSIIIANSLVEKIVLFASKVSFQQTDIIFNMDISYYMFIKPLIETIINYVIKFIIILSGYMIMYYIIVFNLCFDGIDRTMLKNSDLIKNLLRNVVILAILAGILTIFNTQNILTEKFLTLNDDINLTGAGFMESTVKLWGYIIFAFVIVGAIITSVIFFKKNKNKKIMYTLLTIPGYLVLLFVVMVVTDFIFVKPNEFDKERKYIKENIEATRTAYGINETENNVNYSGTIEENEINDSKEILNNIPIVSQNMVKQSLEDTQTEAGYYTFRNIFTTKYQENNVVYIAPREIVEQSISYNNKTYEFTHGIDQIVINATNTSEDGNVKYIKKDIDSNKRIYYGLETNSIAVTNTKNKSEYDYTDSEGNEHTYNYEGNSGIQVGFLDRLILALRNGDIKLAFSTSVTNQSKILTNRNVIERAKTALPYLIYDQNAYTIETEDQIYWVIDAYTVSNQYPYSSYTTIETEKEKQYINYIRNSVKVIVNAYNGEMKFYITDKNDPIISAYKKIYPSMFEENEIPKEIQKQLKYPELLYNVQAEMLRVYHNVKEDVLYRNGDIWALATYGKTNSKIKNTTLDPYYTMLKTPDGENKFGLVQLYTQKNKSNIISYLVGTCDGTKNNLEIYKYSADSNILGGNQLDNLIEQDETISAEINSLNVTGVKISKEMKIIPINNTLLYVETIYQTRTNETNQPMTLEKVVVASGTKVAIGDDLNSAVKKLISQSAVNLEVNNTEDINGLIDTIIKANNNLTDSNARNDWEMMGTDIKTLQDLIQKLDKMRQENTKKMTQSTTQSTNTK
ncbi:MAG: hypothetical protein BHV99_06480 [Clostridium sp. 26_21]|nr:MAG: hypothetical protein BHV99_06480 [Clostridium sp. 26_21]